MFGQYPGLAPIQEGVVTQINFVLEQSFIFIDVHTLKKLFTCYKQRKWILRALLTAKRQILQHWKDTLASYNVMD